MKRPSQLERIKEPAPLQFVTPGEMFERVSDFHELIARRAFELFEGRGRGDGRDWEDWFRAESELLRSAPFEISESPDEFRIRVDVRGYAANEIAINAEPRQLTIVAERQTRRRRQAENTLYAERHLGGLFRVIQLSAETEPAKVSAKLKDGALELVIPKTAKAERVIVQPTVA